MPTSGETTKISEDTRLLHKLGRRFTSTLNHDAWKSWRSVAQKCFDYRDGHQWSAEELKVLKKRKQPPYVNNQIKMYVDYVIGQYVTTRTRSTYVGRNTPADDKSSQTMTALKLFIEQNSQYEFEERDLVEDATVSGFGVLDVRPKVNPETGKIEVKISHVDCFEIFIDPYSRKYDWNKDAMFISQAKWVDVQEAMKKFPQKRIQIKSLVDSSSGSTTPGDIDEDVWGRDTANYVDTTRRRIRIVEQQWKEYKTVKIIHMLTGEQADVTDISSELLNQFVKDNPGASVFTESGDVLHTAVFTKDVLFEHTEDPYRGSTRFTFIPYYVHRKKSGEPFSFVSTVLPMQDAINKRGSKAMHLLNKDRVITEKNNIEDPRKFQEEWSSPDGIAIVKSLQKLEIDKNIDLAATQMQFQQMDIASSRQIARINPDALGEKTPLRSGAGVKAKQRPTSIMLSPDFDNLRRTNVMLGQSILEYIPKYYNGPQVIRITDDPTMGEFASQQFFLNMTDPNTGKRTDVTKYAYDVVMKAVPNFDALHEQEFQTLAQVLPALSNMHPAFAVLLIQASNIKDKEKILQTFQQSLQGQGEEKPKISLSVDYEKLNQQDKNFFRTMMGNNPQQGPDIQAVLNQLGGGS
jgi:hypothetical protein